jgi:protein-tyrosine phosphatase
MTDTIASNGAPASPGWIDLEGAHNVRDLGGLRAGGAHLRSQSERLERGRGQLGTTSVRYTEVEVIGPDVLARRAQTRAAAFAAGLPPAQILGDGYVELLDLGASAFATAFDRIVSPGGAPALVHCAIGKDRTGVLVALLLDAAGVDRDEIVADYARSGERMAPIIARWTAANPSFGLTEQLAAFTAMAVPESMEHVLDHLHGQCGGAAGYLLEHGQTAGAIEQWRDQLVGPH